MTHRWGSTFSLDLLTEDKHKVAAPPLPGQIQAAGSTVLKGVLSNENDTHYIRHTLNYTAVYKGSYYHTRSGALCLINESTIMIVSI